MNKGIFFIILSGLCFIIVNFFVKLLGAGDSQNLVEGLQRYPGHELVLARSVVSLTISLFVIKKRKLPVFGNNKKWLIIRGLSGTIALTIFFYTIHHLPLAIASTIQYLAPIFTVILAMIILKEKVKRLQWFFIGISFLGVALIAVDKLSGGIGPEEISFFWLGLGIISAVFSGLAYTAIIKLKHTDAPITIVFYFPMIAMPIMLILCLYSFTIPQGIEWLFLLLIGIFTQLAQILMTKALHLGSASTITPFQYLGAVYAFLIGYFIFDETLSMIVNIGIGLVISGVIVNAILRKK
ncbi:MAG: DMT family transporter [Crocinitomicaceae bacterium]|nr:DMT family transporter [Crocinitomicaceae bacterium]